MSEGRKDDSEKLDRYDLIPPEALRALAELYGRGARKYAARNWEQGITFGRVFRAMMSHAWKWWNGEEYDPDDGQHHLDSVAWCAFALRTYVARKMYRFDDRREGVRLIDNKNSESPKQEGSIYRYQPQDSAGPGGTIVSGYTRST